MEERDKFDIINYESHFANGKCRYEKEGRTFSVLESDDSYTVQSEPAFPDLVCDFIQYDAYTLYLKTQGQFLKNGSAKIGKWKSYDSNGNLVEEIDYEAGWNIGWNELLLLMDKEGIDLRRVVSILRIKTDNPSDERKLVWIVGVLINDAVIVEYSFDGQTGERFYLDFVKLEQ